MDDLDGDDLDGDEHGGGMQSADIDFDERLRRRLAVDHGASTDGSEESGRILAELQPRMTRASRVRRGRLVAGALAPVALIVGLLALGGSPLTTDRQATVAGEPDSTAASSDDESIVRPTVLVTGTTAPGRASPAESGGTSPTEGSEAEPDSTAGSSPTAQTTTTGANQSSPQDPSSVTTTSIPGSTSVDSSCGSIVVLVVDGSVSLIESLPDAGYRVDVKSEGPEVEVAFEGSSGHCELKAKLERGRLVTEGEDGGERENS